MFRLESLHFISYLESSSNGKKKELEARVEQEKKKQTDAVKKKLGDAAKGFFKK